MCARVISGLEHPLRIFPNPLDAYTLYTHQNLEFMSCGTISFVLIYKWRGATRCV